MELDTKKIGDYMQVCRKEAGLTQAELGEKLGVTPQSVSNWERGESLPDTALLPELGEILHCSVDTLLRGGEGCGTYRRYVTVAQMRGALNCLNQLGELLGRDHFIYRCAIDALNQRMNTDLEQAFADPHIFEIFAGEMLLGCVDNGDYADPRDVEKNFKPGKMQTYVLQHLKEKGMR